MLEKILELLTPRLISGGILAAVVLGVLAGHWLIYRLPEGLAEPRDTAPGLLPAAPTVS